MGKRKKRKKKRGPTPPKAIKVEKDGQVFLQRRVSPAVAQAKSVRAIPRVLGGVFDESANSPEHYQRLIDSAAPRGRKIRVLMTNEASYLHTGFSTYGHEVFKRLHATGKYELAELGSYGPPVEAEPKAAALPWKYYHNMYTNTVEQEEYMSDPAHQFGKWKLTQVLADFKPDVIICVRDHWMDEHVLKNPLRGKTKVIWMPTVDGYPQKWEWLKDYQQVDTLLSYSWFGKRVLEEQSSWEMARVKGVKEDLRVHNVCQPGVDLDVFKPLPYGEAKMFFGVPTDIRFCGTVMRNQPRKLFPRIIEAFSLFKRNYAHEAENVCLLLHTSMPDVGWNGGQGILDTIERQGLAQFVYFSYICRSCGNMLISRFLQPMRPTGETQCPRCGNVDLVTPNTRFGYAPDKFNYVFNLLDVYIQGSIAEGDGMPVNEAKAAGCPVLVSDYSALAEKARNGGGLPIVNDSIWNEPSEGFNCKRCGDPNTNGGTMQWRSHFSRKDLAKKLALLFGDENYRRRLSREARKCAERFYSWDLTAKKWEAILDTMKLKDRSKTWDAPLDQIIKVPTNESAPQGLDDEEWLLWCYQNILCRTDKDEDGNEIGPVQKVDNDGRHTWLGRLKSGVPRSELESHFRSLMRDNEKVAAVVADPERAFMNPIERVAAEVAEAKRETS